MVRDWGWWGETDKQVSPTGVVSIASVEEFEEKLRHLAVAARSGAAIDSLKAEIFPYLEGQPLRAPLLGDAHRIYRGRLAAAAPRVRDLSYPPPDRTPAGRANRAGDPVFYGTLAPHGVFDELRPAIGDVVILSEWRLRHRARFNTLGYHADILGAVGAGRPTATFSAKGTPFSGLESSEPYFRALAEHFCSWPRDPAVDRITAAAAECMMSGDIDGLLYPSIAGRGGYHNVALKADRADDLLRLVRAEKVEIVDLATDEFVLLARGRPARGGIVVWTDVDSACSGLTGR